MKQFHCTTSVQRSNVNDR